ncbi:MAG: flavodoxin family protein [Roseburia hominis]
MSGKKIAIIYKSLTGNTRQVAEAIRDALGGEEIVYFGEPKPDIVADLYFVGSWTDKGSCDGTVGEYLKQLEGKKLAVFGTAGYGGSREYYQKLACRVTECVPDTSEVLGSFYCQGKMPIGEKPLCGDAAGAPGRSEAECERKKF